MPTSPPPDPLSAPWVGIYDSGVGGLGVLGHLQRLAPTLSLGYLADAAWAPYGERGADALRARGLVIADWFRRRGAAALVVACNTATASAIDAVRAAHPGWPVVGIEPAIKPAVALTRCGHVGLLATQGTLASPRVQALLRAHATQVTVHRVACPGLAAAIEACDPDEAGLATLAERFAAPLRAVGCDVVVLGCTHYPFARDVLARALGPAVQLLDPAEAVARHLLARLGPALTTAEADGQVDMAATATPDLLDTFVRRHRPHLPPARHVAIEA
jgi:glutamate racemase